MWPAPFRAEGRTVAVELLSRDHRDDLAEAAADGALHRLWYTSVPEPRGVGPEIDRRLGLMTQGSMLPFAIIDRRDGPLRDRAVGMTTYLNIDATHRRLEIGYTWYRRAVQRTALNTECKYLLLSKAFEELDCIAVEFRTHAMNLPSRRGIERLGAKLDGILRHHMIMPDGTLRDSAVYSIVAPDWPAVKANLAWMMAKPYG